MKPTRERVIGYWSGIRDGVKKYAWWKDGEQQVGTCGTTLKQALEGIDAEEKADLDKHGYTKEDKKKAVSLIRGIRNWVKFARRDGWVASPFTKSESFDTAVTLTKSKWRAVAIMRPANGMTKEQAEVTVWAPDGCKVDGCMPDKSHPDNLVGLYHMTSLEGQLHKCSYCGEVKDDVVPSSMPDVCPDRYCKDCVGRRPSWIGQATK